MKKKAFDLLTLGEILLRLSPPDNERIVRGETFQKQVGGAELNVASGVSLLGLRSGIISRIPDSSIGMFAKNKIRYRKRCKIGRVLLRERSIPEKTGRGL